MFFQIRRLFRFKKAGSDLNLRSKNVFSPQSVSWVRVVCKITSNQFCTVHSKKICFIRKPLQRRATNFNASSSVAFFWYCLTSILNKYDFLVKSCCLMDHENDKTCKWRQGHSSKFDKQFAHAAYLHVCFITIFYNEIKSAGIPSRAYSNFILISFNLMFCNANIVITCLSCTSVTNYSW